MFQENAYQIGLKYSQWYNLHPNEHDHLARSFKDICCYLNLNPSDLSWPWNAKFKPNVRAMNIEDIEALATKYFKGYVRFDRPALPATYPDPALSVVMQLAFNYPQDMQQAIKDHQFAMCAENAVGALLERYLDSQLRFHGWSWCCGDMVKAVDFIKYDHTNNLWLALQIKNRSNSENSSSSAIRKGTQIKKWYRTFSKKPQTNWDNLPDFMQGCGLSEDKFIQFIYQYLAK